MIEMTVPIARMKQSSRAVDVASRASFPRRRGRSEVHLFSGRWGLKAHSVSI